MTRGSFARPLPGLAWAVLAAALAAVTLWVLGRPEPLALGGDNETLLHPMFVEALRQTRAGVLPVWTAGRWGGSPLMGDPVLGVMYLPNYLGYLATPFPHGRAMDLAACAHLAVFAPGVLWCLRRLGVRPWAALVAVALAVVDPTATYVARSWNSWWSAMAWWPWLVGAAVPGGPAQRPRLGVAAVSLAAQVYAGYPQFALYSGTIALAVLVLAGRTSLRRGVGDALVVATGAIGLAAPQILPGLSMAAESMRLGPGGAARLAALDVAAIPPSWWGDVLAATPTLLRLPCKLAPVVLALAAAGVLTRRREVRVLAAGAVVAAVLATGPTPLARVLHHLPGFGFFAGPFKFFYPAAFLVHLLAGVGLERLAGAGATSRRVAVAVLAASAWPALGGWALVASLAAAAPGRFLSAGVGAVALAGGAAFFAGSAALSTPQPFSRDAFTPLLRDPPPGAAEGAGERWIALEQDRVLRQVGYDFGTLWGLASVSGVGPLPPWRQFETLDGAVPGAAPALVRAVGATRVIARRGSAVAADLERAGHAPVAGDGRFVVLAPPGPAPRAFLAPRARMATAEDAVAAAREGRALEPEVLVEAEPAGAREAGDADGRIDVVEDGGRSYAVRVSVDRPTWLVLRAPYYRRWEARIDGAAAVVRPAGGFLLGVRVEAGDHDVVLAYREPGFATGLVVALVASVALAVAARRRATVEKAGRVT